MNGRVICWRRVQCQEDDHKLVLLMFFWGGWLLNLYMQISCRQMDTWVPKISRKFLAAGQGLEVISVHRVWMRSS